MKLIGIIIISATQLVINCLTTISFSAHHSVVRRIYTYLFHHLFRLHSPMYIKWVNVTCRKRCTLQNVTIQLKALSWWPFQFTLLTYMFFELCKAALIKLNKFIVVKLKHFYVQYRIKPLIFDAIHYKYFSIKTLNSRQIFWARYNSWIWVVQVGHYRCNFCRHTVWLDHSNLPLCANK